MSLGIISSIITHENFVSITLALSPEEQGLRSTLSSLCTQAINKYVHKDAIVDISIDTTTPLKKRINKLSTQEVLIKNIILVASGKGGVGKSTVSVNLATSLAQKQLAVGLLDADIYGPSIPIMLNIREKPTISADKKLIPVQKYQMKILSIGFLIGEEQAVVWRGPMVTSAIKQFIHDVHWGSLDYLIIDLPPGTGDIHLTIAQSIAVTGVVIVSTPQKVAIGDVNRAISMFQNVKIPILGIVNNMAYFSSKEEPEKRHYIFGSNHNLKNMTKRLGEDVPLLSEIPMDPAISHLADSGKPFILQPNGSIKTNESFSLLTNRLIAMVEKRNQTLPPTQKIKISR